MLYYATPKVILPDFSFHCTDNPDNIDLTKRFNLWDKLDSIWNKAPGKGPYLLSKNDGPQESPEWNGNLRKQPAEAGIAARTTIGLFYRQ
jgi:hypothetical protein